MAIRKVHEGGREGKGQQARKGSASHGMARADTYDMHFESRVLGQRFLGTCSMNSQFLKIYPVEHDPLKVTCLFGI